MKLKLDETKTYPLTCACVFFQDDVKKDFQVFGRPLKSCGALMAESVNLLAQGIDPGASHLCCHSEFGLPATCGWQWVFPWAPVSSHQNAGRCHISKIFLSSAENANPINQSLLNDAVASSL